MASSLDKLRNGAAARGGSTGAAAPARPRLGSLNGTVNPNLLAAPVVVAGVPEAVPAAALQPVVVGKAVATVGAVIQVPLDRCVEGRDNWRYFYSPRKMAELEDELRRDGQLEPAQAFQRKEDGKFELLGGNRRLRAARQIALPHLKVLVVEEPATPELRARLSRKLNGARADTTILDDAMRWRAACASGQFASQGAVAEFYGVPQSRVSKTIAIAELPETVLEVIVELAGWHKLGKLYPLVQLFKLWTERGADAVGKALKLVHDHEEGLGEEKLLAMVEELKGRSKTRATGLRATPARVLLTCAAGGGGAVKLFEAERKVELQVKDVPPDVLTRLYEELTRTAKAVLDAAPEAASGQPGS
jgi:ParB family chromosome partitioning protein